MRDYNQINHGKFRSPSKRQTQQQNSESLESREEEEVGEDVKKQSEDSKVRTVAPLSLQQNPSNDGKSSPQVQQQQQPYRATGGMTTSQSPFPLSASDALSIRREGTEATIVKLRLALKEAMEKDASNKAALAKSDAVILELRSTVRHLKRQAETINNNSIKNDDVLNGKEDVAIRVVELQDQLVKAHAKIATADMVRKELEDTLEAEQYTWELRVQDQERQILELTADYAVLVKDLEALRSKCESLEQQNKQFYEQHQKSVVNKDETTANTELMDKIRILEQERAGLQSCLDEALKELEMVDAELQSDTNRQQSQLLVEPLQHLYRLVLERTSKAGEQVLMAQCPTDPRQIISAIHSRITESQSEQLSQPSTSERHRLAELQAQCSTLREELRSHEESSAELRTSLKEAVALLKPLQEAVVKADRDKARLLQLQQQADSKQQQYKQELIQQEKLLDQWRSKVESLEMDLAKVRTTTATSLIQSHKDQVDSSPNSNNMSPDARARLRGAKRQEEEQLKQMFHRVRENSFSSPEQQQFLPASGNDDNSLELLEEELALVKRELAQKDAALHHMELLEEELALVKGKLAHKEVALRYLDRQLADTKVGLSGREQDDRFAVDDHVRVRDLEAKLRESQDELKVKGEAEKALNKSLKEALNLLRPLQRHLQDAEEEKKRLAAELQALKYGAGSTSARKANSTTQSTTSSSSSQQKGS